jgi:spore germination protein GerM
VNNQNRVFLALGSLLVGMGLGAVMLLTNRPKPPYVSPYQAGATPPPVAEPHPEPIQATPTPEPGAEEVKAKPRVTYFKVIDSPDGPVLHPETRELEGETLTDEARLQAAILSMTEGEAPILPKGTKLRRLKIDGTTALLDLSKELKENFSGGDKAEQLLINALTATAGQLPGIEKVQIFIEGLAVETLGGTQSLLEPLAVPQKP